MNRGIDKTEKRIKDINSMIDEFNFQMQFREYMSDMYCIKINKEINDIVKSKLKS